jgi:transposase-like protein
MRTRRLRPATIPRSAFTGFCFPPEVIVLAVRWYLRFALSYRDVEELLTERGVQVDHVTIYRWVQRFTPLLAEAARPCRHAVGDRWQVDETYVKVAGQWRYVYRAIDQFGQVIDVFVSPRRDAAAARRFFQRASGTMGIAPVEVVTDHAPVYPAVLEELLSAAWHRTDRYANNHIEADHGLWVPVIRSPHATCAYSWISPPSRSRRRIVRVIRTTGGSAGPSGGACPKARCGRWPL